MSYGPTRDEYGGRRNAAHDDDYQPDQKREYKPRPKPNPDFTLAGERIPPIAKPYKRSGCTWVNGIGWVWNPTRRSFT